VTKEELLGLYKSQPKIFSLASQIEQNNSQKLHLKGLVGSAGSVIAASVYSSSNNSHLFILNDKEEHRMVQEILGQAARVVPVPVHTLRDKQNPSRRPQM